MSKIKLTLKNFTIIINNKTFICPYDNESEDYWYGLKDYDVNIHEVEGVKKATVYPVKDNVTDYSREIEVEILTK